ncbi:EamA/RhaT family transporter [Rhodosalinus halophilus]|uniref:EamA/RhaT family transporter n=2 Tax=Rhodosalinus halophilus TaxID=2259333 RepID=A0A365UFN9_9RHOB|nr:EamA/RhaT family transporter [Rhodosalinus halophilus]
MIGAVFCFTLMDAIAKALTNRIGLVPTLWVRYLGQTLVVLLMVAPRLTSVLRTRYPRLQILRSIYLLCATALFFWGLANIGIAQAAGIMNVNPLLITLGAALFLGERIGPRRALGVLAALGGALMIIRPGTEVFSPYALLPLGAACFYSAYALTTRFVGRDEDRWTSLVYTGLLGAVVLTCLVPFHWPAFDRSSLLLVGAIAVVATLGQLLLITALQQGEAGLVAPFSYTGLLFATVWGLIFFAEVPDLWTLAGMAVIAGAGVYVWHRETRGA